jgi:hypothetical protein
MIHCGKQLKSTDQWIQWSSDYVYQMCTAQGGSRPATGMQLMQVSLHQIAIWKCLSKLQRAVSSASEQSNEINAIYLDICSVVGMAQATIHFIPVTVLSLHRTHVAFPYLVTCYEFYPECGGVTVNGLTVSDVIYEFWLWNEQKRIEPNALLDVFLEPPFDQWVLAVSLFFLSKTSIYFFAYIKTNYFQK